MITSILVLLAVAAIAVFILIRLFKHPGRFILKMLINALIGFLALFVINYFGASFDFSIPVNIWTVLISGCLGLPGVLFLIILVLI